MRKEDFVPNQLVILISDYSGHKKGTSGIFQYWSDKTQTPIIKLRTKSKTIESIPKEYLLGIITEESLI